MVKEVTPELCAEHPHLAHCKAIYTNHRYEVQAFDCRSPIGGIVQLMVHRHFDLEEISWPEMQRIKRELFGEVLALEMYPPVQIEWGKESKVRVVFIMPLDYDPPFGLHRPEAWGNP